jgi:dihydrofolate reductase
MNNSTSQHVRISMIAAIGRNRELGVHGGLLWHIPEDFAYFKKVTMGKPVVMGRTTYLSLPDTARPLPGRTNIVLAREEEDCQLIHDAGAIVVHSVDDALAKAQQVAHEQNIDEIFVIGGGYVYSQFLSHADRLYLTIVDADFPEVDVFFPEYAQDFTQEVSRRESSDKQYNYAFTILER